MKNRIMRAAVTSMCGLVPIVASGVLVFPSAAAAQDGVTISVLSGGTAQPNVDVFWFGDKPLFLGATDVTGLLSTSPTHIEIADIIRKNRRVGAYRWGRCEKARRPKEVYLTEDWSAESRLEAWGAVGKPHCNLLEIDNVTLQDSTIQVELPRGDIGRWNWDVGVAPKRTTFSNIADGSANTVQLLEERGYNSIGRTVEDDDTGYFVGGGATLPYFRNEDIEGIRVGAGFENLGTASSNVTGSRINVAGSPSNVSYTTTTNLDVKLINFEVGLPFALGPVVVTPSWAPGWAMVDGSTTTTLDGGVVGPAPPTTRVSTTTVPTDVTKFGWNGWNVRAQVPVGKGVWVFGQFQSRTIDDVFPPGNEGQFNQNLETRGALFGFMLSSGSTSSGSGRR